MCHLQNLSNVYVDIYPVLCVMRFSTSKRMLTCLFATEQLSDYPT